MEDQIFKEDPWDYLHPYAAQLFGPDIQDREKRALWCRALFCAGNYLRLWNNAVELKMSLLAACALEEGQKVLLVAKYGQESGFSDAVRSLLGQAGSLAIEEITSMALASFSQIHRTTRKKLQWDFKCFHSMTDQSVDRVILFGAASHIANLEESIRQIHRILRSGGRLVIADAPWGGRDLVLAAHVDAHLEGFIARILSGMGVKEEELPQVGPEDLMALSKPFFRDCRAFSWQGLYTFHGQKEGEATTTELSAPPEAASAFLTEKESENPWSFLVNHEIDSLGPMVKETHLQKKWGRAIFFGSNLRWVWMKAGSMRQLMFGHLKAEQGDRVLVVGEFLEELGFLPELRRRVGKKAEIATIDMVAKSRSGREQQWKTGSDAGMKEKHQWDYNYADSFPDRYFDLIWFPQGVHHAYSWEEIAPRILRALKPGGQIMMAECRIPAPEFHMGTQMSGMLKCIIDKIFWGMEMSPEEFPDYSTEELARAFGNSLKETFALEWKGFLIFWGYKR